MPAFRPVPVRPLRSRAEALAASRQAARHRVERMIVIELVLLEWEWAARPPVPAAVRKSTGIAWPGVQPGPGLPRRRVDACGIIRSHLLNA
ncbi:hypothetical protein D3C73_1060970 [compost metagenome]